jgi:hypothetical protein
MLETVTRWRRLRDGGNVWGSVDASVEGQGFTRYRLVVFPPGISATERGAVRLWRAWPTWGALGWLIVMICAVSVLSPWTALATSATVYLAAGAITFIRAGSPRTQVRTLSAVRIDGNDDPQWTAKCVLLQSLAQTLADADELHRQGQLSVVEHEAIWWSVYDRLIPSWAEKRRVS